MHILAGPSRPMTCRNSGERASDFSGGAIAARTIESTVSSEALVKICEDWASNA